ncbi:MAG: aromatic amino acid hydroxylase [Bacteroidales bacterium]|nr:aromatic amino acid hydroxylase [Bacteroidales bacterium]MCF8333856.1 aromatic amino acid hydroxylase [Bacteroidales bacterium]
MELNEVLEKLPRHLMDLVIDQPYNEYTAQDHAVWRFVMRQNLDYLQHVAHPAYVDGLRKTGISIDSIPHMYGMNRILKDIGWAAVAVDGFIPPSAFMEFQAYNVLVIAADIRPIDQIEYTPAPDIIHEAAGHAPIIADDEYAEYLRRFGKLGAKAFSSAMDYQQYEAIRHLSILKADPYTSKEEIEKAEKKLEEIEKNLGEPSEMQRIRNLHWWTVEFGLFGDLKNPKIYGAGLLSSIGESYNCLQDHVKKIPYTIDAVNYSFDITSQQPHLFVTPSFEHLNKVLDEFADTMALRTGGMNAVNQAIRSENTGTLVWNSGLQVSGTFTGVREHDGQPAYLQTNGPTNLNYDYKELPGHSKTDYPNGFGSPVGRLKGTTRPLEDMNSSELSKAGIEKGKKAQLEFHTGVTVEGKVEDIISRHGKNLLIVFSEATVRHKGEHFHTPKDGKYPMAVGESIISGFSGPADPDAFELTFNPPEEKTHKIEHNEISKRLHNLYQQVRDIRDNDYGYDNLRAIWNRVKKEYPQEWLLPMEILELVRLKNVDDALHDELVDHLETKREKEPEFHNLVKNGFKLLDSGIGNQTVGLEKEGV